MYFSGVRIIRSCVCHLERLDPDIVPAVLCMARDQLDKMAVRHVKLLMKEWSFELNNLMQVLDEMTDPQIFMGVSGKINNKINVRIRSFELKYSGTTIKVDTLTYKFFSCIYRM